MKLFLVLCVIIEHEDNTEQRPVKEKTKAYAAAIMDAEGCFSISKRLNDKGSMHYEPHIIFTGKHNPLGKYFVHHFGGTCTQHKTDGYFHWQLTGSKARMSFLTSILPYLFEKRDQAQILIEYISLNGRPNPTLRETMYQQIKSLKSQECVTTDTPDTFGQVKTDHAYLSGIFDGEGSLSLHQCTRKGSSALHYVKHLAVTNTCVPLLNRFLKVYGGTIRHKKQPNKTCYEWNLKSNKEIETFLLSVLPYSLVKQDRAMLMLNFVRLTGECPENRQSIYNDFRKLVTTKNAKAKIQSDLHSDMQSAPAEMLTA